MLVLIGSKIGGEAVRGISGGERKRTAVGVELVRDASTVPKYFFVM
jgi:ABC-type multidrug transport system ATPase subunit